MSHPAYIREKAIQLRQQRGMTIDEIAERLALGRTTIYHWVKDIPIERKPKRGFTVEDLERAAEGLRRLTSAKAPNENRNRVAVANSDPVMISMLDRFVRRYSANPVTYSVQ